MAGAALGYSISSAVEANENFNDCMEARGWRVADNSQPSHGPMAAALAVPEPVPSAIPLMQASSATAPLSARRADLLVGVVDINFALAEATHLNPPRGVMVTSVGTGGTGKAAGLREGDVILDFNGSPVMGINQMQRSLDQITPGSTVVANIWRNGAERPLEVRF
jgi:serine protease Do